MLKKGRATGGAYGAVGKILANTGRWSRKEARELVRAGRVAVDGVTAQAADGKYDPAAALRWTAKRFPGSGWFT